MSWSVESIRDETYRTKFVNLPDSIDDWTRPYGGLNGATVLDFGCGEGTTAIGIALRKSARRVVGLEIQQPEVDRCVPLAKEQLGLPGLPDNLSLYRVEPGKLHDPGERFDVIYSWSVFEHVERRFLLDAFGLLKGALKPGGVLFIQVAPLYYSAEGSHMLPWIKQPWGHLCDEHSVYYDKLKAATRDQEELRSLWSTFRTLNKTTADELRQFAEQAGFEVLRDHRTRDEFVPDERLTKIYHADVLMTNQVVLLLRPQQ